MNAQIEREIRELLEVNGLSGTMLSNLLFNQRNGLFGQLAKTREEREAVSRSALFREALARVDELSEQEFSGLRKQIDLVNAALKRAKTAADGSNASIPISANGHEGAVRSQESPQVQGSA